MKEENLNKPSCSERLKMRQSIVDKICVLFGEFFATSILIFLGCMGCIETESFPNNHLSAALNFGLAVMIAIQCFGCISGAHLNPAVTLAAFVYELISLPMALGYFVAQALGSFFGYGLLKAVMPANTILGPATPDGLCVTVLHAEINTLQGVFIEFIITSILIALCCGVWDPRNSKYMDSVAVRFGLGVAGLSIAAGLFTGASMNPTRSLAPAVWNNSYRDHWVFWVGPMTAALITSLVYKYVFRREVDPSKSNDQNT